MTLSKIFGFLFKFMIFMNLKENEIFLINKKTIILYKYFKNQLESYLQYFLYYFSIYW